MPEEAISTIETLSRDFESSPKAGRACTTFDRGRRSTCKLGGEALATCSIVHTYLEHPATMHSKSHPRERLGHTSRCYTMNSIAIKYRGSGKESIAMICCGSPQGFFKGVHE
jgi:hypothetical protein